MTKLTKEQIESIPVGSIRTFGEYGNPYLVLDNFEQDENGKIMVEIKLLEFNRNDYYSL